ncbi:Cytochrome b5-like heme/steroid binding protein [Glarea lozoyensis ATCC 20868]|uniref:Cytochrome b5-like heme/steroid binding protein n=1 Tax=Glarea lozoyensis (strain ATCC 20868 / MF5171) TaxID=1116229 RepID=S3CR26_GLAL2|nr:Cytochrome b5-like heme/steroid binding protein [Glarea lozoyensis ATCC 20868]EPE27564.1 Cytochrome b5-like heme/steroid binding protein [Glarea lozoyensis ATCC 20868]
MSKQFTIKEVAEHHKDSDKGLYIIVDADVYDVTGFVDEHPGGAKILKRVAGKDASKQFWKYHNESVLKKYQPKLKIGSVKEEAKL